jgi:hypothetical protein
VKKLLEGRTLLNLIMLAFALYCVARALGYGPNSRIFPLVIGIPTAVLLALSILAVWKPSILRGADVTLGGSPSTEPDMDEAGDEKYTPLHIAAMIGWLLFAAAAIGLVGFRVAVPLFIVLFGRLEGRAGWPAVICVALFTWAFIVGYFEMFMKFAMFRGIWFGDMLPLY